jgi:catechol 2,3-dioxygenase
MEPKFTFESEGTMPEIQTNTTTAPPTLDPATTIGQVTLGVANLELMADYYQQVIGLTSLERTTQTVTLGVDDKPLVRLEVQPGGRRYPNATGLYHLALLLPTRQDLGLWLKHFVISQNKMIDGASDHLVSEALYLSDPEGNGLEIYRDRPRDTWAYESGGVKMATLPLDLPALVADAPDTPFSGLPLGSTMGHIHLQVADVPQSLAFYCDVLGFEVMALMPTAGFISAGGYHHHLGMNIWHSRGAAPPPAGSLGLLNYEMVLPTTAAREAALGRLESQGYNLEQTDAGPLVRDPAGNGLVLVVA